MKRRNRRESNTKSMRTPPRGSRYLKGVTHIDYKDAELLSKFMSDSGKIMSRRLTGVSARQQRQLKMAIRRSRNMGLLP
jgi:small subunit ribosomal protein S18